jgi:NOL1/NOP2/fmu family ribosome biogenesis protein
VPNKPKTAPDRPLSQAGWFLLDSSDRKKLLNWVFQIYGIDLDQIINENKLQIWQFKDSLHLFPEKFITMFPNFPVQSLGIPLCEIFAEEYILAHEFVTRFGKQATKNVIILKEDQLWSWMRGEDLTIPEQSDNVSSTLIIKDDLERVFGIGKLTNNRLRNMLPKRVMIHSGLN